MSTSDAPGLMAPVIRIDVTEPDAIETEDMVESPSHPVLDALQIPSRAHFRSNSLSSNATAASGLSRRSSWSSWTPETEYIPPEDEHIERRALLKSQDNSQSEPPDNPFAFTPEELGSKLYDGKDLKVLRDMGGLIGLAYGLRTDLRQGLRWDEDKLDGRVTRRDILEHIRTVHHLSLSQSALYMGGSSAGGFSDRRRVFGENKIPVRPPKNIFQLMWIAMHDKVIILLCIAATIALALGLYQAFLPGSTDSLEWVEPVAILVAVAIVVVAQSVNDWQKERQFIKLNRKKEERQVKVVRGGRLDLISVYDLLAGDILVIESGDIPPVDAILAEGQDVECDESSITGESKTVRKQPLNGHGDPFILSGSKVLNGEGRCVVTAVGKHSLNGRMMLAFQDEHEDTPLQIRLDKIADMIAKWGTGAAVLLFVVLMIEFVKRLPGSNATPSENGEHFIKILIVSVSIVVVAVPEGLPLAVTLSLAYATIRMIQDNNLVRVLKACETIGSATTICSDKTGTLTQNKMTVVTGIFGTTPLSEVQHLPSESIQLIRDGIVINTTAFEKLENGKTEFVGSQTEIALLEMAKQLGVTDIATERARADVVQKFPFSSERKSMGMLVRQNGLRFFVKGASEIVLQRCADVDPLISRTIQEYADASLRTMVLAYRDVSAPGTFDELFQNLTFIGLVGIQDPLRPGVIEAVADCKRAGIAVRMVTGDNVSTAKAIAKESGIYTDGIVMEGPQFRNLPRYEMDRIIPRLQVLARSSPDDKRNLVMRLKHLGEVVAVTGDGTNDAPALHAADIGFSMGIAGTDVAKDASSIILMDDNFSSIPKAVAWGRCVNEAIKKFLQFQLTVSVTAVTFAFVSSVASPDESSALTAVQLLWVNLIQDTLAALALATDPPSKEVLDRPPEPKMASLITFNMWKMIFGESIAQLAVIFTLNFAGAGWFGWDDATLKTMVFNTFVWLQIFNEINCRRIDDRLNVFAGIHRNPMFIGIMVVMVACQILMICVGGAAFSVVRLNGLEWLISVGLGLIALPAGAIVRLIPNSFIRLFIPVKPKMTDVERQIEDWNDAIEAINNDLAVFKRVRNERRVRNRTSGHRHHREDSSVSETGYPVRSASALVPGLVALSMALPSALHSENSVA